MAKASNQVLNLLGWRSKRSNKTSRSGLRYADARTGDELFLTDVTSQSCEKKFVFPFMGLTN